MTSFELLALLSNLATPFAVFFGAFALIRYLNRGGPTSPSRDLLIIKEEVAHGLGELNKKLEEAKATAFDRKAVPTTEEHNELVRDLQQRIREEAGSALLDELRESHEKSTKHNERIAQVEQRCRATIERLREELYSLSRRANLNLSIGIVTTASGLFLLGAFVIGNPLLPSTQDHPTTLDKFLIEFLPRISLVVLIEVFAYFFLSLYKATLSEIKYFQNEITSVEVKFLALYLAASSGIPEHTASAIETLAKTERNFILNKDQTTVDLERSKLEQTERLDVVGKLAELLKGKKEA